MGFLSKKKLLKKQKETLRLLEQKDAEIRRLSDFVDELKKQQKQVDGYGKEVEIQGMKPNEQNILMPLNTENDIEIKRLSNLLEKQQFALFDSPTLVLLKYIFVHFQL